MLLSNLFFIRFFDLPQAYAGRRCTRRPGFTNPLFPSWDLWLLSSMFAHPNTKAIDENYKVHDDYKGGNRDSTIKEGEDVGVLRSPDTPWAFPDVVITFPLNRWCFWKEDSFISRNWSDFTPLKCVLFTPGIQKHKRSQWFWWWNIENRDNVKTGDKTAHCIMQSACQQ